MPIPFVKSINERLGRRNSSKREGSGKASAKAVGGECGDGSISILRATAAAPEQLVAEIAGSETAIDESLWEVRKLGWFWYVFLHDENNRAIGSSETSFGALEFARETLARERAQQAVPPDPQ